MMRFANDNDVNQLRQIWQECFWVNFCSPCGAFYLCKIFKQYRPLVYVNNGKVVSMLTLLPIKLINCNKVYNGLYIWAVGTLNEYRCKNIATKMLLFVEQYSKKLNIDFNLLVPQNGNCDLYNFYFKRGFNINIKHENFLFDRLNLNNFVDSSSKKLPFKIGMSSDKLMKLRMKNYSSIDFISWDINELDLVQTEYSLPEGKHYVLDFNDDQYAIIDLRDNFKLLIREMFIDKINWGSFIKTILNKYLNYSFFEFSLPFNCHDYNLLNSRVTLKNIGMLKQINKNFIINKDHVYFNFALDT